jgi:ElaB/YqjD/DUF883 family membrane-anchored ribosome-binding protein
MSEAPNDGTAAAALAQHSKDGHPSTSQGGNGRRTELDAISELMAAASKMTNEASDQLGEVVRTRPIAALLTTGALGVLVGLVIARR